jgi:hypothetical protein
MKKKEERNEKSMAEITNENKRLSEPLQVALSECDSLKRELSHYKKDKLSLQNSKARLKVLEEKHKELLWEHEVLEQRFGHIQKERDELYEKFVDRVIGVQQKTGFKNSVSVFPFDKDSNFPVQLLMILCVTTTDFGKEGGAPEGVP